MKKLASYNMTRLESPIGFIIAYPIDPTKGTKGSFLSYTNVEIPNLTPQIGSNICLWFFEKTFNNFFVRRSAFWFKHFFYNGDPGRRKNKGTVAKASAKTSSFIVISNKSGGCNSRNWLKKNKNE